MAKVKAGESGGSPSGTSLMNAPDQAHLSYPSGHSTFGTVCAILLADMVPEKRAELFARGLDYAHSRMVVGAHFPTDLEGGRLTGTVAAELLMRNPRFQHDFAMQRASLRAALNLPTDPPN
jgi:acid phosphatase (class A)